MFYLSYRQSIISTSIRRDYFGEGIETSFCGKVANQAVASGLIENFQKEIIKTRSIETVPGVPSGAVMITFEDGDNSIIYVAGANKELKPDQMASIDWT